MSFYPEHYPQPPIHGETHRGIATYLGSSPVVRLTLFRTDHCIDHLRQMVQCYGDVTIIPTRFRSGLESNYIDSNRQHTCRDFTAIREWTDSRFKQNPRISSEHRGGHNHTH